jgi:hypothetical protein
MSYLLTEVLPPIYAGRRGFGIHDSTNVQLLNYFLDLRRLALGEDPEGRR